MRDVLALQPVSKVVAPPADAGRRERRHRRNRRHRRGVRAARAGPAPCRPRRDHLGGAAVRRQDPGHRGVARDGLRRPRRRSRRASTRPSSAASSPRSAAASTTAASPVISPGSAPVSSAATHSSSPMNIRAEDISRILREQVGGYTVDVDVAEVGTVISIGDGMARLHGVERCMAGEMIEFPGGAFGIALNLEEDSVGSVLLGDAHGDQGRRHRQARPAASSRCRSATRCSAASSTRSASRSTARARSRRRSSCRSSASRPASSIASRCASRCRPASRPSTR